MIQRQAPAGRRPPWPPWLATALTCLTAACTGYCPVGESFAYWSSARARMIEGSRAHGATTRAADGLLLDDQYDHRVVVTACTTEDAAVATLASALVGGGFRRLARQDQPGCRWYERDAPAAPVVGFAAEPVRDVARVCVRISPYGARCALEMMAWAARVSLGSGSWRHAPAGDQAALHQELVQPR